MSSILSIFGFDPAKHSVKVEVLAGLTTFLTMSYILAVNPLMLSDAGMDKGAVFSATVIAAVVGTLIGTAMGAKMMDENGKLHNMNKALMADAVATSVGALCGTSTVTTYVESTTGVMEGGRTGLTAYILIKVCTGEGKQLSVFMYVLGVLFLLKYIAHYL